MPLLSKNNAQRALLSIVRLVFLYRALQQEELGTDLADNFPFQNEARSFYKINLELLHKFPTFLLTWLLLLKNFTAYGLSKLRPIGIVTFLLTLKGQNIKHFK